MPIKIIIIAILLYLGYRLLSSDWKKKKDVSTGNPPPNVKDDGIVADVLVEDPVCHALVPQRQAIRLKSKETNTIVYFCSEKCCNLFASKEGEKG